MDRSDVPQRRRFMRNVFTAGAALTSAGLLAGRSRPALAADAPGKMIDTKGTKVGVVLETLSHPLIKYWGDECARQGAGFGMEVSVQDGERNVQKQTSEMEAFISQNVNLLVLQATDAAGLTPVVRKAEKAGIPVITLNQDVAGAHTGFVGMGHYTMGIQVADGMAVQLNKQGNIVVIEGVQGTGANIQRMAGFKEALKKYPDMKIVADQSAAFDRKKGHDVFQTIMQGQPKIDAVSASTTRWPSAQHRRRSRQDGAAASNSGAPTANLTFSKASKAAWWMASPPLPRTRSRIR